jgi:hypothetical protein
VPSTGGITSDGWFWLAIPGRIPGKNPRNCITRSGHYFIPKHVRDAHERVKECFAEWFGGDTIIRTAKQGGPRYTVFGSVAALQAAILVFRRTPEEVRTGERNRRRGDPASCHELLIDALQGCFYDDDEAIVQLQVTELRCQQADAYLVLFKPAGTVEDAVERASRFLGPWHAGGASHGA